MYVTEICILSEAQKIYEIMNMIQFCIRREIRKWLVAILVSQLFFPCTKKDLKGSFFIFSLNNPE